MAQPPSPKRLIPKRNRGGRRHKTVKIYDTQALLEYFETDSEDVVRAALEARGIRWHQSAGRMWVSGRLLDD